MDESTSPLASPMSKSAEQGLSPSPRNRNVAHRSDADDLSGASPSSVSGYAPKMAPCESCGVPVQVKPGSPLILCTKDMGSHRQFVDQANRAGKGQLMEDMVSSVAWLPQVQRCSCLLALLAASASTVRVVVELIE